MMFFFKRKIYKNRDSQRGNMLFLILIAIALIGSLTYAITSSSQTDNVGISKEQLVIRLSEIQAYASELERGITFLQQNTLSEQNIRFSIPGSVDNGYDLLSNDSDGTENQIFAKNGGGVTYRLVDAAIFADNTANDWDFYGGTHLPGVGIENRAELIAVLPNVTQQFCEAINEVNGQTDAQPEDTSDCLYTNTTNRFGVGTTPTTFDDTSPNITDESTFTVTPALQACVECGGDFHIYHVLMAR